MPVIININYLFLYRVAHPILKGFLHKQFLIKKYIYHLNEI